MRVKYLTIVAAGLLVAACQSTPQDTASTAGSGAGGADSAVVTSDDSARPVDGWALGDPRATQDLQDNVGDRVYFGFDQYDVSAEARETLKSQAIWLNNNPKITTTVEGHADERGTREYNLALGERRASSAKNYLSALGVDASRLKTISYGEERPEVTGSNEEAWAANRRAVTVINQQ